MSIQTELTRIINAKAAIKTAIEGKGVTVPEATLLDGMAALIDSIEAGGGEKTLFGAYFETGSIIPASNITTKYKIQFQRDFSTIDGNTTPKFYNFFLWCSIPPGDTSVMAPGDSWAWVFVGRKQPNGENFSYGQYVSSSGAVMDATSLQQIGGTAPNRFTLHCTAGKGLTAGYVYNWIALAPSSEGYAA